VFELFDPKGVVRITIGNLPHWYQSGATYFITFRTEDSVPAAVAEEWFRRRNEWLCRHGIDPDRADWTALLRALPDEQQREFHGTFSREFMEYLDRGHGECVLKRPELASVVAKCFHHFDGRRYYLGDFIVMPNHVHLLVCLLGTTELEAHLVRTLEQFEYLCRYIADNPKAAGLSTGEYLYWRREEQNK
jgi:putative transposase